MVNRDSPMRMLRSVTTGIHSGSRGRTTASRFKGAYGYNPSRIWMSCTVALAFQACGALEFG